MHEDEAAGRQRPKGVGDEAIGAARVPRCAQDAADAEDVEELGGLDPAIVIVGAGIAEHHARRYGPGRTGSSPASAGCWNQTIPSASGTQRPMAGNPPPAAIMSSSR